MFISVGHILNRIIGRFGLQLSRYPGGADRRRRALIKNSCVDTVIDVGANLGQYGKMIRSQGFHGRIISFEPIPQVLDELRAVAASDGNWEVVPKAVTNAIGPVRFQVSENLVSSSLLNIANEHIEAAPSSRTVGEIEVETIRLDQILSTMKSSKVMVKIDVQGAERSVLSSADDLLSSITLLELEMSLFELYRGQALMRELDSCLIQKGFELVSIQEGFFSEKSGELLQIDAIYRNCSVQSTSK